jgi:hypothetical protein
MTSLRCVVPKPCRREAVYQRGAPDGQAHTQWLFVHAKYILLDHSLSSVAYGICYFKLVFPLACDVTPDGETIHFTAVPDISSLV